MRQCPSKSQCLYKTLARSTGMSRNKLAEDANAVSTLPCSERLLMKHHVLFTGLVVTAVSMLTAETVVADHCNCNGGYSIGGCTTPPAGSYGSTTYYAPLQSNGYSYQPQPYYYQPQYYRPSTTYFRGYPSYGYARPGISIQFGSGFGSSYGYRPYNYGFGRSYGSGFGFGSALHFHSRHHHSRHHHRH